MTEVTYYVALPFVVTEEGVMPGEAIECFNSNSAVMRAEASHTTPATSVHSHSAARVIRRWEISRMPR